jgi:hypothetical protein
MSKPFLCLRGKKSTTFLKPNLAQGKLLDAMIPAGAVVKKLPTALRLLFLSFPTTFSAHAQAQAKRRP